MNEEQLLQEARIEAEKVYPILDVDSIPHNERREAIIRERDNSLLNEGFVDGYIANAKKQMSEAVEFAEWLLRNTDFDEGEDKYQWYYDWNLYSSEEIYKLFKQQKQK